LAKLRSRSNENFETLLEKAKIIKKHQQKKQEIDHQQPKTNISTNFKRSKSVPQPKPRANSSKSEFKKSSLNEVVKKSNQIEEEEEENEVDDLGDRIDTQMNSVSTLLGQSIGFAVAGGLFDIHLPRNTQLPTKVSKIYTTAFDYQKEIMLPIYVGERPLIKHCEALGKVRVKQMPACKAGELQIELTLNVDVDEKLSCTAMDLTNKKQLPIDLEFNLTYSARGAVDQILDAMKFKQEDEELVEMAKEFKILIRDVRVKYSGYEVM
jgi:hypothetical protein